jgi:hypothetical protein
MPRGRPAMQWDVRCTCGEVNRMTTNTESICTGCGDTLEGLPAATLRKYGYVPTTEIVNN